MNFNPEALFFDPERHAESLALIASLHLNHGRFQLAFQFADRRCRIVTPKARDFLLRAEASRRGGHAAFAAADLARAIEADPTDRHVVQAALGWGAFEQRLAAAKSAVAEPGGAIDVLRRALPVLAQGGAPFWRQLRWADGEIVGWIAWKGPKPLRMDLVRAPVDEDFDPPKVFGHWVQADPEHPLADCGYAIAEIAVEDRRRRLQRLDFVLDDQPVGRFTPPLVSPPKPPRPPVQAASAKLLTILLPVYEGLAATQACLQSLFDGRPEIATRLIVIDDASPNAELAVWLDAQALAQGFELIRNDENLGFARSVNRALNLCPSGDVLLLNADTLPPPGCLDRLAAAAYAAADIGTVTPLSNNGEFTSFPKANVSNPLGAPQEIVELDRLAQKANGGEVIDLPNGVGFCLYIRRDCLEAVGPLPELYARGYYEDVEFCLRAREKGFRNVCAVGVFVGHAGSLSFGADKRALVMRNLVKLEARFPDHERQCAAFVEADPLRPARAAIEALSPVREAVTLLVCPSGAAEKIAEDYVCRARQAGDPSPAVLCIHQAAENRLLLRGAAGMGPRSLEFCLDDPTAMRELGGYLGKLNVPRLGFCDPLALPDALIAVFLALDAEVGLICGDLLWLSRRLLACEGGCDGAGAAPCDICLATGFAPMQAAAGLETAFAEKQTRLRALLGRAKKVWPVDRLSEAFARRLFVDKVAPAPAELVFASAAAPLRPKAGRSLGLLAPTPDILVDRLIVALAREFLRRGDPTHILVLGRCVNDLEVMATANVFVTGDLPDADFDRLIRQCEVRALISPCRTSFFGLVDRLARQYGLPKAYFDWSFGLLPTEDGDLSLDPRVCDAKAARALAAWSRPPELKAGI